MKKIAVALVAVSALGLSACGGSQEPGQDGPEGDTTPTTTAPATSSSAEGGEPELEAAVTAYSDAFLSGDMAAYDLLSQRCRDRTDKAAFRAILDQAKELYGSPLTIQTYEAEVSGDLARVTYTYEASALNQDSEPWVREGGEWRNDDC